MSRHRHQEFIRFLYKINRQTPAERAVHLIVDNYATHKHPKVRAWLGRHHRFQFHFTPTSASWLNSVEVGKDGNASRTQCRPQPDQYRYARPKMG